VENPSAAGSGTCVHSSPAGVAEGAPVGDGHADGGGDVLAVGGRSVGWSVPVTVGAGAVGGGVGPGSAVQPMPATTSASASGRWRKRSLN
jgi:hypothetical protein